MVFVFRAARLLAELVGWLALLVMAGNYSGALDVRVFIDPPARPAVHEVTLWT